MGAGHDGECAPHDIDANSNSLFLAPSDHSNQSRYDQKEQEENIEEGHIPEVRIPTQATIRRSTRSSGAIAAGGLGSKSPTLTSRRPS